MNLQNAIDHFALNHIELVVSLTSRYDGLIIHQRNSVPLFDFSFSVSCVFSHFDRIFAYRKNYTSALKRRNTKYERAFDYKPISNGNMSI